MVAALVEALEQAQLEIGKTYTFQVGDNWVEFRVLGPQPPPEALPLPEVDIMREPWVALLLPTDGLTIRPLRSEPDLPDIPDLPEGLPQPTVVVVVAKAETGGRP